MAYQNFVPEVWVDAIQRDLERLHIFATDCNRQYEGEVSKKGDSVRILGVGKPTITTEGAKDFKKLSDPETVEDSSVIMYIDQMSHFNYKIDDIDKIQAQGGIMEALNAETSEGLADAQDNFIAKLAASKEAVKLNPSAVQLTKENILPQLDLALQRLYENDVRRTTKIVIDMDPATYTVFKQAYIDKDTDNSDLMANGAVSKYSGAYVKLSNNVHKVTESGHAVANIMVRTQRAIAFACPKIHIEPYRPESGFADAVKGFALYGAKIVRPKEMIILNGYV
jgi:hypothetical protein